MIEEQTNEFPGTADVDATEGTEGMVDAGMDFVAPRAETAEDEIDGGVEVAPAVPEIAPAAEVVATPAAELSSELKAIVEFCDNEIATINAAPKKSNYHNARRSAFKAVRDMISPPPPKPAKVKKTKTKATTSGEAAPTPASNATPEIPGETHVVPFDGGA